ncbi:cytochrome c3 family protein [Aporhodopirellula aestuarii]|uniref:Doubled CXXCH motif domain-containing protein n=1 Tax=Aporhodopirellula aestuarii TaxID=2950107 RepID=A0ABT0UCK5_9BACT|nr:cytochrome c3 family protein [Aporhodopirellula aestuarii]MCM2374624.1 hypothetical protein [Aporhodopirellula aestuarii]
MQSPTGKQRSQRIQIDYYKRRTGLDRWRRLCILLSLLFAGTYAIYLVYFLLAASSASPIKVSAGSQTLGQVLQRHFNTGPLSLSHASFERDCHVCHSDFTPMDANAPSDWLPLIGVNSDVSRKHLEDACQKCHFAGNHNRDQMTAQFAAKDQNCSWCHQPHQGRDFDLTRISRKRCATCHDDLTSVTNNAPTINKSVTAFNEVDHGDFASLKTGDAGRIRFSHDLHMMPGQVGIDAKGGMTLDRLSPSDRVRYSLENQKPTDLVQLNCQSCHEIVGQTVIDGLGTNLKSVDIELLGRSMTPIDFEKHCVACHAISPGVISSTDDPLRLPHAVSPTAMRTQIAATIDGSRATGTSRQRRDNSKKTLPPGIGEPSSHQSEWRVTDEEIAAAEELVRKQCLTCHFSESLADDAILASTSSNTTAMIPTRWLRRGLYDHAAHRLIDCRFCHADAYPKSRTLPQSELVTDDHEKVLIAGIESCQGCHRPADTPTPEELITRTLELAGTTTVLSEQSAADLIGMMPTWASDECILCHRYHSPTPKSHTVSPPVTSQSEAF